MTGLLAATLTAYERAGGLLWAGDCVWPWKLGDIVEMRGTFSMEMLGLECCPLIEGVRSAVVEFRVGLLTFLMVLVAAGLCPTVAMAAKKADQPVTVYLAGDSTVASYPASRAPLTGWGQVLERFFTDAITVKNEAVSGRSSKSFIDEGRLTAILNAIQPGDYLFIQFAHNDEKSADPKRYTEPQTSFKAYLRQYVDGARVKGAYPILVTPMHRRGFVADGTIRFSHGEYPNAILELADEMQVPVVDLHQKSQALFEAVGVSGTKRLFLWLDKGEHPNYPDGKEDNTHFSEHGAVEIARLVVEGLREAKIPLADYLKDEG
jgi:lysophospholipase L1-like esterase